MQRIRVFDLFVTAAAFFFAGAAFAVAMARKAGWQRTDTQLVGTSIMMLIYGCIQLRIIYRRLKMTPVVGGDPDPRPNDR